MSHAKADYVDEFLPHIPSSLQKIGACAVAAVLVVVVQASCADLGRHPVTCSTPHGVCQSAAYPGFAATVSEVI